VAFVDVSNFPGEVEGVLDAGVAAEAVELRCLVSELALTSGRRKSIAQLVLKTRAILLSERIPVWMKAKRTLR
jgi:hypothetical protein